MKKFGTFLILFLMITSLFFIIPPQAKAAINGGGDVPPPQPGSISWSDNFKGSDFQKKTSVSFVENDDHESGWANFPYQFEFNVWHTSNQRVTVDVWIRNITTDDGIDLHANGGWYLELPFGTTSDKLKPLMQAELIQKASWKNASFGSEGDGCTGWKPADMAEQIVQSVNSYEEVQSDHWRFTFLTNSTNYTVGVFGVAIRVYMSHTRHLFWTEHYWLTMATIYGEFSVGDVWVPPANPPNNVYYDNTTHSWPPAQFNMTIAYGKYRVKFWYAGPNGSWQFNRTTGNVTGPNVKLMEVYPSTTSFLTKDDNPVHLEYKFNGSQPAGEYIWEIVSYSHTGQYLYSWTSVIIDNATSEDVENGTVHHPPPKIIISFDYSGTPAVNHDIYIVIRVYANDSTTADIWVDAFYGANLYMAPPPWLPTMEYFNHPARVYTNGTPYKLPVRLRFSGALNVYVSAKDDAGAFGGAKNFLVVSEDNGGGGNQNPNKSPPWLKFPWQSTAGMVMLFIGIALIFSRRPVIQLIGIGLFFASFINWQYVGDYIKEQVKSWLNPLKNIIEQQIWRLLK